MAKASPFNAAEYLDSPESIADYLSEAFESGDEKLIARALGTVARAKGMTEVANDTGLSRESLYLACTRFRRHQVRCFNGTGGASWNVGSSRGSSSLRLYG
jgi:probable addiction module antidote protein